MKAIPLLLLLLTLGRAQQLFNPYPTKDCHACKTRFGSKNAYFCNEGDKVGYCCPYDSETAASFYGCQSADNRACSSETPEKDFYFKSCFNLNKNNRCGVETDIRVGYTEEEISLMDFSNSDKSACVWEFWDRTDGFKKFSPEVFKFRLDELENMDVFIAVGDTY